MSEDIIKESEITQRTPRISRIKLALIINYSEETIYSYQDFKFRLLRRYLANNMDS